MPKLANFFLASLSDEDAGAVLALLKNIQLPHGEILYDAGREVDRVYFPTSAVISLVVCLSSGEMVEAAMVGRDGVIGAAAALDGRISLSRAVVQLPGEALVGRPADIKAVALQRPGVLSALIRHEQTVYAQAQQSTACMATHNIEERLCRWLLRARDLAGSDTLLLTQQYLAEMLGVQRTSVTLVAHTLQEAGMIRYSRGKITILNVDALRDAACECYETVNDYYAALIGTRPRGSDPIGDS